MKLNYVSLLVFLFLGMSFNLSAQRDCGSMDYLQMQLEQDPKRGAKLQALEQKTQQIINSNQVKMADVYTIPVVVHVIYNTNTENISDAQIASQMQVLNDDFRRLNSDADNTWAQAADIEIEFCMATVDPNGNSTNGITRTQTSQTSFGTNDQMKFNSSGGKDAWPADQYLNMWVCDISGGILGYAQFPGGSQATDGVVMDYQYFGTIGTATSPFDLGRTTTHEVGHWLNLRHIWGDGACGQDDFVADTPESDAANYGCATGHQSCGSTDMVQNYMDYSDDACMNLFTDGQKARMRAIFQTDNVKAGLLTSTACGTPAAPTCDDGIQNQGETGVDCGGPCPGACPTCDDGIQNQGETGIDCGGPNCNACPCLDNSVVLSITLDNYPEETSWTLVDENGTEVASGGTYGSQPDGSTVTEEFCLVDGCYDFTINDAYGDGICCGYGNGSYSLTGDGNTYVSGGQFGSSETSNFCLGVTTGPTCTDGIMNGNETGVDCGGPDCSPCASCTDGVMNGNETGVDCGGPDCPACPTCDDGIMNGNETGVDCGGPDCSACVSCQDGIMNGDETGVDCGGSNCPACPTCFDGIMNGNETGIDCGGDCSPCVSCNDGIMNGAETGVDCGGPDCPACPTNCNDNVVTLTINLDNYPEETSWSVSNANGTEVASGGTYGNQPDGSTITEELCLPDGCYDFVINDTYGDGICCGYGNGSYSLTGGGNTYASGGQFGGSETTNFCINVGPNPTCTDGIMNGNETGIDCGGSCPACETCNDGIQNNGETGIDCGGPNCDPCQTGNCTEVVVNSNNFDSSWGIWNDGGSDCRRSSNDANYAYSGNRCVRLRDNTSTSTTTTDLLDLSNYEEITVDFTYIARSMDNSNEDFWLQISTNGGSSYTTVADWNRGIEFENLVREFEAVTVPGPFSSNTRLRFRCDASGNSDWVYIDDVLITGCTNGQLIIDNDAPINTGNEENTRQPQQVDAEEHYITLDNVMLYPNPATDRLNVKFNASQDAAIQLVIQDMTGKMVQQRSVEAVTGKQEISINAGDFTQGIYFLHLMTENGKVTKKFVIVR